MYVCMNGKSKWGRKTEEGRGDSERQEAAEHTWPEWDLVARQDACSAETRGQVVGLQGNPGLFFYTKQYYPKWVERNILSISTSHLGTVYLNRWASLVTKPSLEISFQPFSTGAAGEARSSMTCR